MRTYKLLPGAEKDIENIWLYTLKEWGMPQADDYIDLLDEAFLLIADQPLLCRERTEFTPPVRIYHQAHHLVVYVASDNGVVIIRVLHESMDFESLLDESLLDERR